MFLKVSLVCNPFCNVMQKRKEKKKKKKTITKKKRTTKTIQTGPLFMRSTGSV